MSSPWIMFVSSIIMIFMCFGVAVYAADPIITHKCLWIQILAVIWLIISWLRMKKVIR